MVRIAVKSPLISTISLILILTLVSPRHASSQSIAVPGGTATQTFADEFDGTSLDRSIWSTNYTNVLVNLPGELQSYTPDTISIRNGRLQISADRRSIDGYHYTSGVITTFGSFSQAYGYFEIRARLPIGSGLWPALWMLPAEKSWPPEIDIVEFLGRDMTKIWSTYHWLDANGGHQKDGAETLATNWASDFHTFSLQWRPELLVWYIDGREVKRIQGPHVTSAPMFLLANLAIGGEWAGAPNASTKFPALFEIDYIRAYQYDDLPKVTPRDWRHLTASASSSVVAPGREVTFTFGIETSRRREAFRLQTILFDSSGKRRVAKHDFLLPLTEPGQHMRSWTLKLPEGTSKGLYVVSIAIFNQDWSQVDWLNNATTILVQ